MICVCKMKVSLLLCIVLVNCLSVSSKPTDTEGGGVVNMEVGEDTPTQEDSQWTEQNQENTASNQEQNGEDPNQSNEPVQSEQANQQPAHIPREEEEERKPVEEEIDWGHGGGGDQQWNGDFQQEEDPQQQEQQFDQQQHVVHAEPVGVPNPEELAHGDNGHAHDQTDTRPDPNSEEAQAEAMRLAAMKKAAEETELQGLNPQVQANVHDGQARTAAEFMKNQQFGPGDMDEVIHGGHHVHGAEHEGGRGPVQAGDMEFVAHGETGVRGEHDKEKEKPHLTVDPEQLIHAGEGDGHDHNPHEVKEVKLKPGAGGPKILEEERSEGQLTENDKEEVDKEDIGPIYEKVVHGQDHVHGEVPFGYRPKNVVRYKDIIDLGLDQAMLKGIDLNKLLEQEQNEFEDFQRESREEAEFYDDDEEGKEAGNYWQRVDSLRAHYMRKLYAKVREITVPDLENAEWDVGDEYMWSQKDPLEPHDGESQLEHEMEMWANTMSKGDRKPFKVLQGRRGMNEEHETEEGEIVEEFPEEVLDMQEDEM